MSNSIGKIFTVTSFGESHGRCVGVVVDGCPAGLPLAESDIQIELDKRKPGAGIASTSRGEEDKVEILSGIFRKHTTGAPICMLAWNRDKDSSHYEKIRHLLRPGHADYTSLIKYGGYNDYLGSGRFSGRITAGFVMAGAIAQKLLKTKKIEILSHTVNIGGIKAGQRTVREMRLAENDPLRCADISASLQMMDAIEKARAEKDSLGGIIETIALNVPPGFGEPVFGTLEGEIGRAMLSIPAVKGVEFGAGFAAAGKRGSENNDVFTVKKGKLLTVTNHAGGINGGISNGMPVIVRIAVKPTPSIGKKQPTYDIEKLQPAEVEIKGRHDACIVPRAVPVATAMMALVLCDLARRSGLLPEVLE